VELVWEDCASSVLIPVRVTQIRTEEDDVPVVKRPRGRPLGSKVRPILLT
jgi:hypothetical protein